MPHIRRTRFCSWLRAGPRLVWAALLCALPTSAAAYIEPGVGSMLLQALVGGAAGLLVALKLYWYELTRFWRRLWAGLRPDNKTSGQTADTSPASAEPPDSH